MVLTDSLVSYWKCDEASGNLTDAHGSNTPTDNGSVGSATGKIGNGRDFESGSSQYFSLADNASISVGDIDFTWAFWVKLESKAASQTFVSHWDGTSNQRAVRIELDQAADRFIFVVSSNGTGGGNQIILMANTFGSPSISTWYYIVAWHDSVANTVNIQVNNGTVDSTSWSAGVHNSTAGFKIGAINATPSQFTDGVLDEIGFWKRVLTSQERTDLYNGGVGLAYPLPAPITGTGALTIAVPSLAASGAYTPVPITGTGGVVIAKPALAGEGTSSITGITGTGGVVIAKPALRGYEILPTGDNRRNHFGFGLLSNWRF